MLTSVNAQLFWGANFTGANPPALPTPPSSLPPPASNPNPQPTNQPTNLPTKPIKVGNQGYLVFSGVYSFAELKPHFAEFCTWLGTEHVAVAFIAGHFNVANAGCQPGMATNQVYAAIRTYPGCKELDAKGLLMYQEGHEHCNMVVEPVQRLRRHLSHILTP